MEIHSTILHYIIVYYTVPYYTVLYYIMVYFIMLYYTIPRSGGRPPSVEGAGGSGGLQASQ